MIKLLNKLPYVVIVACSGGPDSMAALHFLSRKHKVYPIHVNHHKENGLSLSEKTIINYLEDQSDRDLSSRYLAGQIDLTNKDSYSGLEDFWRQERYKTLFTEREFVAQNEGLEPEDVPIITAHNLDDCVETWIWSCLNDNPKLITNQTDNYVVRPFLTNEKKTLKFWCEMHVVPYYEDETNLDTQRTRNYIRHKLMPHALAVNPGLYKTVKKRILREINQGDHNEN